MGELLCLLSVLADVPLRQDLAVTGSISQWGEVQAVGGVNEKIEGFFDVCRERQLTGTQGVCIPETNVRNLVLRPDVVEAIKQRKFHIWAVSTIDQAIEIFTGMSAGKIDESQSFHGRVRSRLTEIGDTLWNQERLAADHPLWVPGSPIDIPPDPRPRLPGRE